MHDEESFELETLVTVEAYTTAWEAQLAKARLESEGIHSVVADEHLSRLYCANMVGGVKLRVREQDATVASELLRTRRPIPEIYLVTEADLPLQPRCPACNSDNLAYKRFSRAGFLGSLLLFGFPLPLPRYRWSCRACGEVWKEEEIEGGAPPAHAEEIVMEDGEEQADLIAVARFATPWEAHLARTLLESEGIDSCVMEERMPSVNLLTGQPVLGNRLEVHPEDALRAGEILARVATGAAAPAAGPEPL